MNLPRELSFLTDLVLTLNHTQAKIEKWFSINHTVNQVNMNFDSIIARKLAIDYIKSSDFWPHNFPIAKEFLQSADCSR